MAELETVEVNQDGNKVRINKSDFDPDKHQLWGESQKPASQKPDSGDDLLAVEYEELHGKKPHHKMKPESIREAIAKAKSEAE